MRKIYVSGLLAEIEVRYYTKTFSPTLLFE